jgi:hypothetical protein
MLFSSIVIPIEVNSHSTYSSFSCKQTEHMFCSWNRVRERSNIIFRFVKYLSTVFYTYLPVNIHFQFIIITNVSILTDPAYFVLPSCHCGILALRSRDFWEITLTAKHVFGLFTWKTWIASAKNFGGCFITCNGIPLKPLRLSEHLGFYY